MSINYHDNNVSILEQVLTLTMKDIFVRLRMGLADWDMDVFLREALINSSEIDKIKDLIKKYDDTYETSIKSNITLNEKYKILYKLRKK